MDSQATSFFFWEKKKNANNYYDDVTTDNYCAVMRTAGKIKVIA